MQSIRSPAWPSSAGTQATSLVDGVAIEAGSAHSVFLELFAGSGGLTAAVARAGLVVSDASDILGPGGVALPHFDLRRPDVFKELRGSCLQYRGLGKDDCPVAGLLGDEF